jgi:hypothetical protein
MTTPNYFPTQYQGDDTDYLKVKCDRSGAARPYAGTVTVPATATTTQLIGLTPFNKGARFQINSNSVACGNWGGGSTTCNLGYVYDENTTYTNNEDAWATLSTAPQSGGFITVDEVAGLIFVAEANGWITVEIAGANADAESTVTFNFTGSYDGLGVNNSNNQS